MSIPDEMWVSIFMLLDLWSVVDCIRVCKSWSKLILSPQFRKQWCEGHSRDEAMVLLSFSVDKGEKPAFTRFCLPPNNTGSSYSTSGARMSGPYVWKTVGPCEIVSSSNGLLLARVDHGGETRFDFAVGNPLMVEWVMIPRPPREMREIIPFETTFVWDFTLKAELSGEYRISVYHCCENVLLIYDSRTKEWTRGTNSPFFRYDAYDLERGSWVMYELPDYEDAYVQSLCVWEHKGEFYAGGVTVETTPMGSCVWKLVEGQRAREVTTANAAWAMDCPNEDQMSRHNCHGEGKFFCRAGAGFTSRCPWTTSIYDLTSDHWNCLVEHGDEDSELYCTRALAYHPSLIMPAGLGKHKKGAPRSKRTRKARRAKSSKRIRA